MTNRYALRFETGERRGETVPITGQSFTVGRRPGTSIQIVENSVSGRHAELSVDGATLTLRDLGSTNGTRVNGERVLETTLTLGAEIAFGNVLMRLVDPDAGAGAEQLELPREVPDDHLAQQATEIHTPAELPMQVSAENLARARKGSKAIWIVLLVVVAAGAGAYFYLEQTGRSAGTQALAVEPVAGNLLTRAFSFEADTDPFTSLEAPGLFVHGESSARSGLYGISADLAADEWAVHASEAVRAQANKEYQLQAHVRLFGDAQARIGFEFSSSIDEEAAVVRGYSSALAASSGFELMQTATVAPAGFDQVRALVFVRATGAGGGCDVDDVALVAGDLEGPAATLDEYKLYALGEPALSLVLFKVDRVLLSDLRFSEPNAKPPTGCATLTTAVEGNGVRIDAAGLTQDARVRLKLAPEQMAGGVATIGSGGYAIYSVDFTQEGVTDVLIGGGLDLVRLRLESGCTVVGRARDDGFELTLNVGAQRSLFMQLAFREERAQAVTLAGQADDAESQGNLGECLQLWQRLLDEYPYESGLIARAEKTRGRLIREGLEEVRELSLKVERARFFRLVDLYRECHQAAEAIGQRYAGSEVEAKAEEIAAEIRAELGGLEVDLDRHEVQRLEAIQAALAAQGAETLAGEVERYLSDNFGGQR